MQGVLQNTLAALGYFIFTLLPQPNFYSFSFPVEVSNQVIIHIVSSNENIIDLAEQYYGSKDYWTNIWMDNPQIQNPNALPEGLKINITSEKPLLVEKVSRERLLSLLNETSPVSTIQDTSNFSAQVTPIPPSIETVEPTSVPETPTNFDDVYKQAGEKYGVPWQILYGLHLTETGLRDGAISNAQGSGAQGPMQFMPGTWKAYGVDGNSDGVADINNAIDAIHSAANYLARHGGVNQGLHYYGGNTSGTLAAACERGYCQ